MKLKLINEVDEIIDSTNKTLIENCISKLKERKVVTHYRKQPLNIKKVQKADYNVPDVEGEYFDKGILNQFAFIRDDIQKHILTINSFDIIYFQIDSWGISLVLEQSVFDDCESQNNSTINQSGIDDIVFCQRMIYKDAIPILEKLGYKQDTGYISFDKEGNRITNYRICEEWNHEKHHIFYKFLAENLNSNKGSEIMIVNKADYNYSYEKDIIKFTHNNYDIQEHMLTLNGNDVITLYVTNECIFLDLERSHFNTNGTEFSKVSHIRKNKQGYIFCLRIIYQDALRILKKLGYKKETEHLGVRKEDNKFSEYNISEKWVNEKHNAIFDCLISIVNISKRAKSN